MSHDKHTFDIIGMSDSSKQNHVLI